MFTITFRTPDGTVHTYWELKWQDRDITVYRLQMAGNVILNIEESE